LLFSGIQEANGYKIFNDTAGAASRDHGLAALSRMSAGQAMAGPDTGWKQWPASWHKHDLSDMLLGQERLLCRHDLRKGKNAGNQRHDLAGLAMADKVREHAGIKDGTADQPEVLEVQGTQIERHDRVGDGTGRGTGSRIRSDGLTASTRSTCTSSRPFSISTCATMRRPGHVSMSASAMPIRASGTRRPLPPGAPAAPAARG